MPSDILWFLPWCVAINASFDLLIWFGRKCPWVGRRNTPIDMHSVLPDGYRLLGDSTTWLGLLQAIVLGIFGEIFFPNHYFFWLAVLVWCGHAIGSFIKRRMGFPRGTYVPGIDHIDYVVVAGGVLSLLARLSFASLLISIIITMIITPFLTLIAYKLNIRSRPI